MNNNRSIGFPLLLITIGVLWLLSNAGLISAGNLWALTHVWPYLLIMAGLGLIAEGFLPGAKQIVSLLTVLGLALAVVYAPALGWDGPGLWNLDFGPGENLGGAVRGSGNLETETRELGSFDAIDLRYPAQVTIVQGEEASIQFTADDNLLPQLSSEVRNGELVIRNSEDSYSQRVDPSERVVIQITVVTLERVQFQTTGDVEIETLTSPSLTLDLNGAGDITALDITVDDLRVDINGAGTLHIGGTATDVRVDINGAGDFDADELAAKTANIEINGLGDASIQVSDSLNAEINGAGSISYYGDPDVRSDVNGLGTVRRAGD